MSLFLVVFFMVGLLPVAFGAYEKKIIWEPTAYGWSQITLQKKGIRIEVAKGSGGAHGEHLVGWSFADKIIETLQNKGYKKLEREVEIFITYHIYVFYYSQGTYISFYNGRSEEPSQLFLDEENFFIVHDFIIRLME